MGNPVALQLLVNEVSAKDIRGFASEEEYLKAREDVLREHKETVNSLNVHPSDRKKLLALPFQLAKYTERPKPNVGTSEMKLFEELYGKDWYWGSDFLFDPEEKMTEFNYEKFFSKDYLDTWDTNSQEFKDFIRKQSLIQRTELEQHRENQERFKNLMPMLVVLDEFEQRSLIHLIRNNHRRRITVGKEAETAIIEEECSNEYEIMLAKLSEKANYEVKNRYLHQKRTMDYADKRRMPVDEQKVKDLLRHQHEFREKIEEQLPTYEKVRRFESFQYGLLLYVAEAAYGELKELMDEVNVRKEYLPFNSITDLRRKAGDLTLNTEEFEGYQVLSQSLFTPLDMTDYEDNFTGWNEFPAKPPLNNTSWVRHWNDEKNPQTDAPPNMKRELEERHQGTGTTMQGALTDKYTEVDPPEYTCYGQEDEDEYGDEEGGDDYGDYGDYGEEEADLYDEQEAFRQEMKKRGPIDKRHFRTTDKIRDRYNEVELDNFMKLLNI